MNQRTWREGAVGALLDEHERAVAELLRVLAPLTDHEYEAVRDPHTADEDCRSIQSIVAHVVRSGYGYADYLRAALGLASSAPGPREPGRAEAAAAAAEMVAYLSATLEGRHRMTDEEITATTMRTRWGGTYDLEQLLEHAIVHVLRHRRQIERFLAR